MRVFRFCCMVVHARPAAIAIAVLLAFASRSTAAATDSTGRRLLEMAGIDAAHWDVLANRQAWSRSEDELLHKVMFRLEQFSPSQIHRWAVHPIDVAALARSPETAQGEFFRLDGVVTSVDVLEPTPDMAARFELTHYYRVDFLLGNGQPPQRAIVFTRVVPQAWRAGGRVDQPAAATAMFLKIADADPARPVPIFAAPRIAWYPDTLLGQLGMDVGLLDDVVDRAALGPADRPCFYAMLEAVGRAAPGQLMAAADAELQRDGKTQSSVVPLFNDPAGQRGRLVALEGTVRRAARIAVDEPELRKQFGIDHYYELYLFTDDSQGNPVVFCVRELPDGMPLGDGRDYAESIRVAGFFLKSWAYRSAAADTEGAKPNERQLAPLLVGRKPVWRPATRPADNRPMAALAGGAVVLVLLTLWFVLWKVDRGDRRFKKHVLDKHHIKEPLG